MTDLRDRWHGLSESQRLVLALFGLSLAAHIVLLLVPSAVVQYLAVLVIAGIVPGALLVEALVGRGEDPPPVWERLLYIAGTGYVLLTLVTLALSYLPGGLAAWQMFVAFDLLALALAVVAWRRSRPEPAPEEDADPHLPPFHLDSNQRRWLLLGILALLLVGGALRLANLGYAEFHGDEARATLRAAAVMQGYEDVLMLHKKGPGEILLPAAFWSLSGQIDEASARLPFALASLAAMFAVFLLGWRMLGPVAGWSAAMLFALDGYFIAFARFVQYQSVVVLLAALVVLVLYRLYVRPRALTAYLALAALFMATALLYHYDAAVTLIPAFFLLVAIGWKKRVSWGELLRSFAPAAVVGGVILAGFYLPYVLHPHFQVTFLYLADSRVGRSSLPYNNLVDVFLRSTVYNSSYYVLSMIALLVIAMILAYRRGWKRRWGAIFSVGLLLLLALTTWRDDWLAPGSTDYLFLPFTLALGLIWVAPRLRIAERALWLWFGLPFILAMFFIDTPRTHIHIFITPWALLAGGVIEAGWRSLAGARGQRVAKAAGVVVAAIAILLFGYYAYVYFVYNQDEVLLTWEENHPSAYWTPYDSPESDSIYGFPFANGWKVVGVLYDRGEIQGDFETNQWFSWIPDWYTRGQHRCAWSADWYFAIDNPEPWSERSKDIHDRILAEGYGVWGVVEVNGDDHMTIYKRGAGDGDVRRFALSDFEAAFDEIVSPDLPLAYPTIQGEVANPLHVNFGDKIWLEGYDLEYETPLKPGDTFLLTLYWRAQQTMSESYKVFNQSYYGEGHMVAQQDGYPLCGRYPTPGWRPGELITDSYRIRVRDVPDGVYPLYTGLYLEENFERLPVLDEAGNPVDNQVHVTDIVVEGGEDE